MMVTKKSQLQSSAVVKDQAKPVPPTILKTPQELIHISHTITLKQYKLWLLVLRAFHQAHTLSAKPTFDSPTYAGFLTIRRSYVEEQLGYHLSTQELKIDLEALRRTGIVYNFLGKDSKPISRGAGFISEWEVTSNWIGFKLPDTIKDAIKNLDLAGSIFQKLNWQIFNRFSGKYDAVIYKLCVDYANTGYTPVMSIPEFRSYMGLEPTEYTEFKDLNKFLIKLPIQRINASEFSDIEIVKDPTFGKQGRYIVSVQFQVKRKAQLTLVEVDEPAFSNTMITLSKAQQEQYLDGRTSEQVQASILRANEYIQKQQDAGKDVNIGAIYRTAITDDWGKSYSQQKQILAQKDAETQLIRDKRIAETISTTAASQRDDFVRFKRAQIVSSLTPSQVKNYTEQYISEVHPDKTSTFDPSTSTFKDKVQSHAFSIWLKLKIVVDVDQTEFETWLATPLPPARKF